MIPDGVQLHLLSFEGPDRYASAGGIASRVLGLSDAAVTLGLDTHLWFVGDPKASGEETRAGVRLHRWCQWISRHHPGGVYDGEEGKLRDFAASLPPRLVEETLAPQLRDRSARAIVMAEEWHTVHAVYHLDWLLRRAGLRDRVALFWNANNMFGFDRIDWMRLRDAATITTVSRYMRHRMWPLGVDPLVIPNGVPASSLEPPDRGATKALRQLVADRVVLAKVARWDPDKRWLLALDTVALLKRLGWRPLLIARGGVEGHGVEVMDRARMLGLAVATRSFPDDDPVRVAESLAGVEQVDVVNVTSHLGPAVRAVLFTGAHAVLANSGHEPFGLVGLEAMAAGGLACTGATGEDYAISGWNALVLQTDRPEEFVSLFGNLRANPHDERAMRRRGRQTAQHYVWREIIRRNILPRAAPAPREAPQRTSVRARRYHSAPSRRRPLEPRASGEPAAALSGHPEIGV